MVFALGSIAVASATAATLQEVLPYALVSLLVSTQHPIISAIRADLRFRDASFSQLAGRCVTAASLAAAVALGIGGDGLVTVGVAFVAGEAISLAAASLLLVRAASGSGDIAWDTSSIRLRLALPYAANSMINISLHRLDVVIVALLMSAAQMTAYAPASRIQDALYVLPAAVAAVALPHLARERGGPESGRRMLRTVRRLWRIGLAVTVPTLIVLVVFMPDAIRLALGPEYVAAASPSRIIVWAIPAAVIGGPLLAFLVATGRGAQTTLAFATALAVSLALHLLLDPRFGAEGAAVATVGRDVAIAAVAALLVGRVVLSGPAVARPRDAETSAEIRKETVP
jgi:O-antigen/teichoic acid export membrane protein